MRESGWKKEFVPRVSVRDEEFPASLYTVKLSYTYMAWCVATGEGVLFGKLCDRRQRYDVKM